ncbi:winged helix-turn-helix domain-containing protein [Brevundimonas sp. NPDC058933]|uniref:winged helix-turn-helix domain-containing protein n=1 Tax=Brevundimonas sp. NPDC058933 TaxID=3346673 RepID=UPI003BEF44CA
MNDLSALLLRPIDLVSEPSFALGSGVVHPASLEVVWSDESCKLEPRVMQVLVALNRGRGSPLSREELSRLCWDGRVVGDDALVRCIGRLRKVFQRDPAVEIASIPKVGYRLRLLSVASETTETTSSKLSPGPLHRPRRWLLASGVAAIAALGVGAFLLMKPPGALATEAVRPLTSDLGVETHPALSPDGRMIAYAGGAGFGTQRDIFLRGVADGTPIRLTRTAQDEMAPAWSPDGRRIAFVRRIPGAPCEILVAPAPQGEPRVVGRCSVEAMTRLAWTRGGEILLSDRPTREAVRRIRALSPDTGRMREVTAPPATSLGDLDPVVTHRGDHVVFRRAFSYGVADLYAAEVSGAGLRPLTRDGWKAVGYAFAADDRTLVFSSNRGGDSGLWSVDFKRPGAPVRLSLGLLEFGRLSSDKTGLLAAEAGDYRSNLFAWRAGAEPVALTDGNTSDWDPDLSRTGQLTFVSDQNGGSEIWSKARDGQPTRLTDLKASSVFSPRWSPDGLTIAFVASRDGRTDVYLINAGGSGLRNLTSDGAVRDELAWDRNGDLLVPTLREGGWRIERINAQGRVKAVPSSAGALTVKSDGVDGLYAVKKDDDRLWRLDTGGMGLTSPLIRIDPEAAWTPTVGGVYHLTGAPGGEAVLRLTAWSGESREVQSLGSFGLKHSLAVSPTQDIVAARVVRDEADLRAIRLTRR